VLYSDSYEGAGYIIISVTGNYASISGLWFIGNNSIISSIGYVLFNMTKTCCLYGSKNSNMDNVNDLCKFDELCIYFTVLRYIACLKYKTPILSLYIV